MPEKRWNWQQPDWPNFTYHSHPLDALEQQFLQSTWELTGVVKHLNQGSYDTLVIELMSEEAKDSFAIEGELLNRNSLQSSIRKHLGLPHALVRHHPREYGVAEMMSQVFREFSTPLSHDVLFHWHRLLMVDRQDLDTIGGYRLHPEAMEVVSGYVHKRQVHFQAPPSQSLPTEMDAFIKWFNESAPTGPKPLRALERAGVAHWYFLAIHPFEDGNGRIARGLVNKILAQASEKPSIVVLSTVIEAKKKQYYQALAKQNTSNHLDAWLTYFAEVLLEAQAYTQARIEFTLEEARLFERFQGDFNERQSKVLHRLFQAGPWGFKGGLSAKNYMSLTGASPATATRDLQGLVDLGILKKTGELKGTRYWLEHLSLDKPFF
jgi:Fic family protein